MTLDTSADGNGNTNGNNDEYDAGEECKLLRYLQISAALAHAFATAAVAVAAAAAAAAAAVAAAAASTAAKAAAVHSCFLSSSIFGLGLILLATYLLKIYLCVVLSRELIIFLCSLCKASDLFYVSLREKRLLCGDGWWR
jgi:hypothetical protein